MHAGGAAKDTITTIQRMGWAKKLLAQASPGVGAYDLIYTCPARFTATITSIFACETNAQPATFRITHSDSGSGSASSTEALFWNNPLIASQTLVIIPSPDSSGVTIQPGGKIYAGSNTGDVTFSIYGYEESEIA
jgi:hypothetical protein